MPCFTTPFEISTTSLLKKDFFFPLPLKDHKDWGHLLIFSRTLGHQNYVPCVPATLPTAKSILMCSAEDAGWSSPEPLYVSRYDLWPFCCQCHFHCLLGEQSTAGSSVPTRKMSKEVSSNCAVNAIIWGPAYWEAPRASTALLYVLPCCELPFNAFPRAALEMCYWGSEIENNILNGPSVRVLFLASG